MIGNRIEIDDKTSQGKFSNSVNFNDIDSTEIERITREKNFKCIQISKNLPDQALKIIDEILFFRPDLVFRIYGMYKDNPFDLTRLLSLCNIRRLHLDILEKKDYRRFDNLASIYMIPNIEDLYLSVTGNVDINFIKQINNLKSLYLLIGGGKITLDNAYWMNRSFKTLQLGGVATSFIEKGACGLKINKLVLFQSSINSYDFLLNNKICELQLIKCKLKNTSQIVDNEYVQKISIAETDLDKKILSKFKKLEDFYKYPSIYEIDQY